MNLVILHGVGDYR